MIDQNNLLNPTKTPIPSSSIEDFGFIAKIKNKKKDQFIDIFYIFIYKTVLFLSVFAFLVLLTSLFILMLVWIFF